MTTDLTIKSPTVGGQGSSRTETDCTAEATAPGKTRGVAAEGHDGTAAARNNWRDDAACANYDGPADWFANEINEASYDAIGAALQVCNRCPVRPQCLQHALDNREDIGIWGGLTAAQRDRVRRGQPPRERFPVHRCGTSRARRRHRLWGETCSYCDGTNRTGPCGNRSGHRRHVYEGQRPCWPCVEAERFYQRSRPDRRAGAKRVR